MSSSNNYGVTAAGSPNMKSILQNSPKKNGMGSEMGDLDFSHYNDLASNSIYNE